MTVFITGGTSSIGRVLVKEWAHKGESLRVLVRKSSNRTGLDLPEVEFIIGDVTDGDGVRKGMAGCDRVCHLAAVVGYDLAEAEWWRVNRDGTRNVLKSAFDLGISSMVQVSTIGVLGPTQPGETADETRPVDTTKYMNLYQKTKHAGDEIAREYAAKGLNVKIIYPCFGYGCSWASSHTSMQDQTLLRMAAGKPVAVMGSGKNRLCLAYYKDTVEGIRLAHEKGKAGDDYILGGENLTFPQIWAAVANVLGEKPPTRRIPLPVLIAISRVSKLFAGKSIFPPEILEMFEFDWCYSSAKARNQLGWQPRSFQEGIVETWAEYQAEGRKASV